MDGMILFALLKKLGKRVDSIEDLSPFSYKESVTDYSHLPISATKGDVYTTDNDGSEYLWTGTKWLKLGPDAYTKAEVDKLLKELEDEIDTKQDILVSGQNIKTINGKSILGEGNINTLLNDEDIPLLLDDTINTYRKVMRAWFVQNGAKLATSAGLTALVDKWYDITRDDWSGGVEFYQPSQSTQSTGTKVKNNAGKICVASTDTVKNQDDYEGLPLFAIVDCNFDYDTDNSRPLITAINGITDNFDRYDPDKLVGVLQQSAFHYYDEEDKTYVHGICAQFEEGHDYCKPYPEAVEVIGTNVMRSWVCHAKYMAKLVNNKLTSYSGVVPTAYVMSQNKLIDYKNNMNNGICGGTIIDYEFLRLMFFIKYGSMSADGILQGCVNYNYQYCVALGEEGVKRVLLTSAQAANIQVGSTLLVGTYNGSSKDRNTAANYNISGNHGAVVLSKESVTIDDASYVAVYLDLLEDINTVGDGTETSGNTIVSTFHWKNGSCDGVLGNDGSPVNPKNGVYPAMLQGIEYSVGGWEVFSDVILSSENPNYRVYVVNDCDKQSKNSIANYTDIGHLLEKNTAGWKYPKKLAFKEGIFFPDDIAGSSSVGTKDGVYCDGATTEALREWQAFGHLNLGPGYGGLSTLNGNNALSNANWIILGRSSCNGNRGEYTA